MEGNATAQETGADLSLVEWHDRLEKHFLALAARRAVSDWPVFALEHGLDARALGALEKAVHRALAHESPSLRTPLPWVVYAAEIGYRYRGDEYWQSFAAATPGWHDRWRDFIRESFQRFAAKYYGARPKGAWAGNFPIISWPITHGVLPRYLQQQLARLLYDARFSLRPQLFATAAALGAHLRGLSYDASTRFQEFAENPLLLGQIAAALLVHEPENELLSSSTLRRIVDDINRERAAAEWLKEARSSAQNLRVRGLSSRLDTPEDAAKSKAITSGDVSAVWDDKVTSLGARFMLRPRAEASWDVLLELPDLTPVVRLFPHHREALARSRCRVPDSVRKFLARGQLLGGGAQKLVMDSWPEANAPLVELEGGTPELSMLLSSSFRGLPGQSHLFRVAADGLAYAQKERAVRPGGSYVLLRTEYVERPVGEIQKASLSCRGIHALQFTVPDLVSQLWKTLLQNLDLRTVHTLNVWPVGLCPAEWDGQGDGTWLERDEILLGVRTDHEVDAVEVSLGGGPFRSLPTQPSDKPNAHFIGIGRLPEGMYQAIIRTVSARNVEQPSGRLTIRVRAERAMSAGSSARQPIVLSTYPAAPALEDVWEGRMQLQLRGPANVPLTCRVRLRSRAAGPDLFTKTIHQVRVPLEPEAWDRLFDQYVRKDKTAEEVIDVVQELRVEFDGGALGRTTVSAEREFTPLRWAIRREKGRALICLVDDGGASSVEIQYRALGNPDRNTVLGADTATQGMAVPFPGGLFVASDGPHTAGAVFVPPMSGTLGQLRFATIIAPPSREPKKLGELVRCAAEWENARLKGAMLAAFFRRRATQAILCELCGAIGGTEWLRAEHAWCASESEEVLQQMKHGLTGHADERPLAATILERSPEWTLNDLPSRQEDFAAYVRKYARSMKGQLAHVRPGGTADGAAQHAATFIAERRLCDFALCAASSPAELIAEYTKDSIEQGIGELLQKPIVLRAARLAVVAVHHHSQEQEPNAVLYAGWQW